MGTVLNALNSSTDRGNLFLIMSYAIFFRVIFKLRTGVAAVRFLRGTLFAEVRIGIRDLRVKSAVRQTRQYALFAAIRIKPNYALFSL